MNIIFDKSNKELNNIFIDVILKKIKKYNFTELKSDKECQKM